MGRAGTVSFVGLAVATCAMAAAPLAGAGSQGPPVSLGFSKGLQYMKGTYNGVVTQTTQGVDCDGDAEATGGGGAITGPPNGAALNESFPTQPGPTGWTVEGNSTAGPQDMTGYAICAGVDTDVLSTNTDIPSGSSTTQASFCTGQDVVTGGGIEASNTGVLMSASYPPELQTDNWFTLAKNTAVDERVVYSHALCSGAFVVKYRNSDVVNVQPGKTATAAAACKRREAVLGGGFVGLNDGLPAAGGWVSVNRPRDSKKDRKKVPDDGWVATYHNDSVVPHRLLVRAVCKAGVAPT